MGIETRTSGSSGRCLTNWPRQESVGQEISEVSFVSFMHHFTYWTLFISRINRAWLYKGHEDSGWQLNVDLAQLVRHWPHDLEVLVSNPTGGNFWRNFFFALPCKDLSDNLTETPIVKNSTDTPILNFWWRLPWVLKPGWISHLHAFLSACHSSDPNSINIMYSFVYILKKITKLWNNRTLCSLQNPLHFFCLINFLPDFPNQIVSCSSRSSYH